MKKRSLARGNKIYVLGPPPHTKPVVDRNVPSTYEQYVEQREEREHLEARDRLLAHLEARDRLLAGAVASDATAPSASGSADATAVGHAREVDPDNASVDGSLDAVENDLPTGATDEEPRS